MIRAKELIQNLTEWQQMCKLRNVEDVSGVIVEDYNRKQHLQLEYEQLAQRLKLLENNSPEYKEISLKKKNVEKEKKDIELRLEQVLLLQPNWLSEKVPQGTSVADDVKLTQSGECLQKDFCHESARGYDRDTATKISGTRTTLFRGNLARLEWALTQWLINLHMSAGFEYLSVPSLVTADTMRKAGKFPKFLDDAFCLDGYSLIPTGEVPLVCSVNKVSKRHKVMTFTQCFRKEAGAAGKDAQGWVRVHQFPKVELVTLTTEEDAAYSFEELCDRVELVVTSLGLTWRKMRVCSGEIGAGAYDQIDFEVWLAGQRRWLEVASVSDCRTYQSERMHLKTTGGKLAYTLNATGGVPGRLMAAILEQHHQDGTNIAIPQPLQIYLGGAETLEV